MTQRKFATFRVAERLYGVEVDAVQEILRPQQCTPIPLAHPAIAGLLALRGELVTAVDLRKRLDPEDDGRSAEAMNVVLAHSEELVSLMVDAIGDLLDVEDDQFAELTTLAAQHQRLVSGAYHVDGGVLHVLDVDAVLEI